MSIHRKLPILIVSAFLWLAAGCTTGGDGLGLNDEESAYATGEGDANYAAVQMSFEAPETLRVGEQVEVPVTVENVSDHAVYGVRIIPQDPSVRLTQSDEGAQQNGGQDQEQTGLVVGSLMAGESKTILTYLSGAQEGSLERCFAIEYNPGYCATINVVQPELEFMRSFIDGEGRPVDEQFVCDELFAVYRVRNVGTGESLPITVREDFSEGLMIQGSNTFREDIGTLESGELWEERYPLTTEQPVSYTGVALAATERARIESSPATVTLNRGNIELSLDGPSTHKMFRTGQYQATVRNTSDVTVPGVELTLGTSDLGDADVQFNTQVEREDDTFMIGELGPNESRTILFVVNYDSTGEYRITAQADGYCAESQSAALTTVVEGVPALLLEMIDTVDPVIQGQTTQYRVQVTNQGTARDTDIELSLQLPDALEYVGGEGTTPVSASGDTVTLGRVDGIDPAETVEWLIEVQATAPGSVQTTATLRSNAVRQPVQESEPTNLLSAQ